jgi:sugar phosphate isomerase/epimerase
MKRICEAVNHPAFGVLLHFRGNAGDAVIAPYAMHTHLSWDICMNAAEESIRLLRGAGYQGYYGIEHHSGENEYTRTEVQVARVREVLSRL